MECGKEDSVIFCLPLASSVYNILMVTEDLIKHQNMWVAYSKDRKDIVGRSKSLKDLLRKIKGKNDLIVSFLPPASTTLSP